jgi:hypothetical protein
LVMLCCPRLLAAFHEGRTALACPNARRGRSYPMSLHPLQRTLRLTNGLSGAHSRGMDNLINKILGLLFTVCVASIIAFTLGYIAHYEFGLSPLDIRRSALMGAAIFALLEATLWFAKLRKSK